MRRHHVTESDIVIAATIAVLPNLIKAMGNIEPNSDWPFDPTKYKSNRRGGRRAIKKNKGCQVIGKGKVAKSQYKEYLATEVNNNGS